jgi:RNA polymerase sigma-70 factor (ECF subfamily)
VRSHDKDALMSLLASDATWTSDGGGKARAARKVVVGADRVARFGAGVFRKLTDAVEFRAVEVNGETGLAVVLDGRVMIIMSIHTDGRKILGIYSILNPDKLSQVAAGGRLLGV